MAIRRQHAANGTDETHALLLETSAVPAVAADRQTTEIHLHPDSRQNTPVPARPGAFLLSLDCDNLVLPTIRV